MIATTPTQQTARSGAGPPDPTAATLELTGRDYLSYSALSTYQRCPLKFYLSYVARLEPAFKSSALVFGSAIHAAIEHRYRQQFEGADQPDVDELVDVFTDAWKADAQTTIRFGKSESEASLRDLAVRMLRAFSASEVSIMDTQLLGVEEEFRAPIVEGCPDVLGRIDLLTVSDQAVRVTDFKTARSAWNQAKIQESTPQQLLYAELARPLAAAFGDLPVEIEWIVITKTKTPSVKRHTLRPDPRQVSRVKAMVKHVWSAISAGHFYPVPSTMSCSSCPFQAACDHWEG